MSDIGRIAFMKQIESLEDIGIKTIKGIGDKTVALFKKVGVENLDRLVHYYPRSYDVYEKCVSFNEVFPGKKFSLKIKITSPPVVKDGGRIKVTLLRADDGTAQLDFIWFNMPYLRSVLKRGSIYVLRGMANTKNGRICIEHPEIFSLGAFENIEGTIQPVYSLTAGLKNKLVAKSVRSVLEGYEFKDWLPDEILKESGFTGIRRALEQIHFPDDEASLKEAAERLIFDEFFLFLLKLEQLKLIGAGENRYPVREWSAAEALTKNMPYELTRAQKRIIDEIRADMESNHVMNRLIQGDVGSGKTILAFYAMTAAFSAGYQSALMAPTEVLAVQHYRALTALFQRNGLDDSRIVLLTGSVKSKEKKEIYDKILSGTAAIVIGTHAVIQEKTLFDRLALVITDEQHRFGVAQRDRIRNKGDAPHVLVMSATPIPRTLALILYGDMSVSRLDEMPARRLKTKNCVVDTTWRKNAYSFILKEIKKGHQAYIISPMIEPNEDNNWRNVHECLDEVKNFMPRDVKAAMLHGRMSPDEKTAVMQAFSENKIQILVSTTVVEVGVNVPNATVMMIENAECFGLAQLHQLRGRIGRGEAQSYCIFMQCDNKKETNDRLKILNESNDGFYIASEDLKLRGQGDLFGLRQSGMPVFNLADPIEHSELLKTAADYAHRVISEDPELTSGKYKTIGKILETASDNAEVVL